MRFGNLFSVGNEAVISINPEDSVVLINMKNNRILTYEEVKNCEKYYFDSKTISLLGSSED